MQKSIFWLIMITYEQQNLVENRIGDIENHYAVKVNGIPQLTSEHHHIYWYTI